MANSLSYRAIYQDNEIKHYSSVNELIADFTNQSEWSIADVMIIDLNGNYFVAFRLTKQILATALVDGSFEKETQILFGNYGL